MLALVVYMGGCVSSSVRYTRSGQVSRTTVPRDWDYRDHYRIPEKRLRAIIASYLGTPYRYGGKTRGGMDCSGFVVTVFHDLNRARLPRSTRRLRHLGKTVPSRKARPGDLVFFRTGRFRIINHVGIYLGQGKFAHASSTRGVTYNYISESYYAGRLAFFRRLF